MKIEVCQNQTASPEVIAYLRVIQELICSAWTKPKPLSTSTTHVFLHLTPDGGVSRLRLDKSAGLAIQDTAAIAAVRANAPYQAPPPGLGPLLVKFTPELDDQLVRLIDQDQSEVRIMTVQEARRIANEKELQLQIVDSRSDPPVVRIIDLKAKCADANQRANAIRRTLGLPETHRIKLKFDASTSRAEHDESLRLAEMHLRNGAHLLIYMLLAGHLKQNEDLAVGQMQQFLGALLEFATVVREPTKQGAYVIMILIPKTEVDQ